MTDEPHKYTLRTLRYIEPGSDSPWKEVLGTQSDGTHRPQYYAQLELPKILEQIHKEGRVWFPLEAFSVLNKHQLVLLRKLFDTIDASASSKLSAFKFLSSLGACSTEMYLVSLRYIFLSSEGKALARVALKLYTGFNASGEVSSSFALGHLKGFLDQGTCASSHKLRLKRLLTATGFVESLVQLGLTTAPKANAEVTCALNFSARKPCVSASSCSAEMFLDYIGYGAGFYNYGLSGV